MGKTNFYTAVLANLCFILMSVFVVSPVLGGIISYNNPADNQAPGTVSKEYLPPSGVMPVIVLQGSPYEMGYQYGLQAPEYMAIVRDAAWASALSTKSYSEITESCEVDLEYIKNNLTSFQFEDFFRGISDSMDDQGYDFTSIDPVVMLYYGSRQGPVPEEHCTAFAVYGNSTGGELIVGDNFDFYQVPANSYSVLLALYPEDGYSCIIPSGAGRTGASAVVNENGLVYVVTSGPSGAQGDTGNGIIGYLELGYVGMCAGSVSDGEDILLNITRGFSLNRLLADTSGDAEVIEASHRAYSIRDSSDDFIIATNHFLDPEMSESQSPWDPLQYNPSSYYRYITAEKMITGNYGTVDYSDVKDILSSTDWWDGKVWHMDDPWSANTKNRFRSSVATLYSFIAIPDENIVSICQGNPDMPLWGTKASGLTGTYFNITVGYTPEVMVYNLRSEAEQEMWETVKVMGSSPGTWSCEQWSSIEDTYWEGVWWHDKGTLETDPNENTYAFGKAATAFSSVVMKSEQVKEYCLENS